MKVHIQKGTQSEKTKAVFMFRKGFPQAFKKQEKELKNLLKEGNFNGSKKSAFFTTLKSENILVVGLGEEADFNYEQARRASAFMYKELKKYGKKSAEVFLESLVSKKTPDLDEICQAVTEGAILTSYKYDDFKLKKEDKELRFFVNYCEALFSKFGAISSFPQ